MGVAAVADAPVLAAAVAAAGAVHLAAPVAGYLVRLVRATRASAELASGASPRAAAMLAMACRARAALEGRDYVIPDDVQALALPALRHRVILAPNAEIEGRRAADILAELIAQLEAPK
jgi:MoxR-like ATPase